MPNIYDGTTGKQLVISSAGSNPTGDAVAQTGVDATALMAYDGVSGYFRVRGPWSNGSIAQMIGRIFVANGTQTLTALNAVASNQNGADIYFGCACNNWTFQVNTTGSPTGYSVQFQGSLDGVNYTNLGTAITNAAPGNVSVANTPYSHVRANLSGLAGGSSPTVTALMVGY